MQAILEYAEADNDHVTTFWFRPEHAVDNVAGQFTELYLPHHDADERGQKRWFTIFSSPTERLFAITTKFAHQGSTFKRELRAVQPGDRLHFAEPMGDFILPKDKTIPLVFVAGGIGITPFRSMIKWLTDTKERRNITLIYSVTQQEDLLFTELFNSYGVKAYYVVTKPGPTWTGLAGPLTAERILELVGPIDRHHIYLSGPEPLVETLTKTIRSSGVPKHQVITDYFPNYTEF